VSYKHDAFGLQCSSNVPIAITLDTQKHPPPKKKTKNISPHQKNLNQKKTPPPPKKKKKKQKKKKKKKKPIKPSLMGQFTHLSHLDPYIKIL
jgi:hypothetical protein